MSKKSERQITNRKILQQLADRLQVPVPVAIRVLAGQLLEAELADQPDYAQWQQTYQVEGGDPQAPKAVHAAQIAADFGAKN